MKRFSAFLERKDRENKDHLRVLGKLLEKAGFQIKDRLNHHMDSFLYIEKPTHNNPIIESLEFGGIRIYTRGSNIVCWRCQNKETAEPFGTAYQLDVEGMYRSLMKDNNNEKVGKDLAKYIVEEVLNFFLVAAKTQKEDEEDIDDDSLGKIVGGSNNTDYADQVGSDLRRNNTN